MDDVVLAGTHQQICTALNLLTNLDEGCGLEPRIEKSELSSPVDLSAIDNMVKRNSKEGLAILGAAIGNPSFVTASLRKRVNKIEKLLDNLAHLVTQNVNLNSSMLSLCPKDGILPAM